MLVVAGTEGDPLHTTDSPEKLHYELDQWENLVTESAHGPIYTHFTNKLPDGWTHESFRPF